MLTRRRLFEGETVSDVVAAVLTRPIDLAALPPDTPARVRELVARCLERDPKRRLRDIGEARIALELPDTAPAGVGRPIDSSLLSSLSASSAYTPAAAPVRRTLVPGWAAVIAGLIVAAGFVASGMLARPAATADAAATPFLLEIGPPPEGDFVVEGNVGAIIIAPDGTSVAFAVQTPGGNRLFVRNLATGETRQVPGTIGVQYPFWSPDSRKVGFFSAASKLMTVALAGGLPEAIADAQNGRGGSWTENGEILFTPDGGDTVHRVPERGGAVTKVTTLDVARGENAHYWPVALPGGRKFLFFVRSTISENNGIYLGSIDGTPPVRVLASMSSGLYAPPRPGRPGRLLWVRDSELLAQTFDPQTGTLGGDVATVAQDVRVEESQRGTFAGVSNTGTIVWASSRAADYQFAWYDRSGKRLGTLPVPPGKLLQPAVSPDGRTLVYTRASGGSADIMQFDIASGAIRAVTSSAEYEEQALWSPTSRELFYQAQMKSESLQVIAPLDGSRPPSVVYRGPGADAAGFMPDGRTVLVTFGRPTLNDIGMIRPSEPQVIIPLITDPAIDLLPAVSPDGRWLAFTQTRNGQPEVTLAPLLNDGGTPKAGPQRVQVSAGGSGAFWRNDSRELLYVSVDRRLMSVTITPSGTTVTPGTPTPLFSTQTFVSLGGWGLAATPDLQKFVSVEAPFAAGQQFRVLTGWK